MKIEFIKRIKYFLSKIVKLIIYNLVSFDIITISVSEKSDEYV